MKKSSRANKGQFSIIAALLVSVILVTAVISTYSMVRHAPLQDSPKVLTAIGEMNADINRILDFTVGYYGSILQVTGNSTYARGLTTSYLSSGLVNIARSHPEWNPSFDLNFSQVSTSWFMPESYSMGNISVTYSLAALGIEGIHYETSSVLKVTMLEQINPNEARLNVTRDNNEPELGLGKEDFWFYSYTHADSTWELVNPENDPVICSNGTYVLDIPSGVDPNAYSIQVADQRGLMVPAFYSQGSLESGVPHYTYTFDWDAAGMGSVYSALSDDTIVIEVLQNGTLRWLGQNLTLTTLEKPIPPLPVKALHVNTTISGVNQEVPFQVEDWGSNYKVPLGLSTNASVFNNRNLVVFLVDHTVEAATLWWDGRDITNQTSYAWNNIYFEDDNVLNPNTGFLSNGILDLTINMADPDFEVTSTMGTSTSRAEFLRINGKSPVYYSNPAYIIHHGIVRDIIQQEAEWNDYDGTPGIPDCPNMYSQIVLTLPANARYYTYALRTIFVDSSDVSEDRTLSDLSILQLSIDPDISGDGEIITEDGMNATGFPIPSYLEDAFYNSGTDWEHHWSEFLRGTKGAGVMFTDSSNLKLYTFDSIAGYEIGALFVEKNPSNTTGYIEVNPVHLPSAQFDEPLDVTWHGAVVTFNGEPIYTSPEDGDVGLWVMVEHPPSVTVN